MSYIISEDGKELLKDVRDFCINEVKEQVKEYDISGEWPKEIYDKAIEMQLHMMDVPEAYGGLGLDHIDQAAIVEQIAWADAGVAVTLNGNGLALKPVLLAGNDEQKQKCCDIIINGGFGSFALTEPNAGCDAGEDQVRLLEGVDAVNLQQDVARDAAGQADHDGDAAHAEDVVFRPYRAERSEDGARNGCGELEPIGDSQGYFQHEYPFIWESLYRMRLPPAAAIPPPAPGLAWGGRRSPVRRSARASVRR